MKLKTILLLTLFFHSSIISGKITNDIIPTIILSYGETKSIPINDLFFAENYNCVIIPDKNLNVKYDKKTKLLNIGLKNEKTSFAFFRIAFPNDTLAVPVRINKKYPVSFSFRVKKNFRKVTVFGSFNSWNRSEFPMKKNGDYYGTTIYLRPGNYQYKFFADGFEYCDPGNSDSVANGMGGYNSVLVVSSKNKDKVFLHRLDFKNNGDTTKFLFYLETNGYLIEKKIKIFSFSDNRLVPNKQIKIDKNYIIIKFPNKEIRSAKILRVISTYGNITSNMQNIFLENGKPKSTESSFDWHRSIIYSLIIDRFNDGDKTNSIPIFHDSLFAKANYCGGDFQGIINKLKSGYFDSLGINTLWISPVYDNPSEPYREYPPPHRWFAGYHGYWPVNSFNTDEHFGSLELLKNLVEIAHNHKIKVLLDFVSNHVHIKNPVYKNHPNWFGSLYLPDGRKNIRFWDEFRLTTWFEPYLPSFDYIGSDEAVEFMTDNALWWLKETNADGFRHDAVKHVPNRFWRRLTEKLKKNGYENIFQIGETFGSDLLISSYVNNGQLNAQFNFNLYDTAIKTFLDTSKSFDGLIRQLNSTFGFYGENNLMGNIMDSHDKIRFIAYADGDLEFDQSNANEIGWVNPPEVNFPSSYRKVALYYAYLFAIPGIPVIYYGSEFGLTGAADPDNRRMMRFPGNLNKYENYLLNQTSKIVKLRKKHSALNYGDFYVLKSNKNQLVFVRSDFNERILIVLNKSFSEDVILPIKFPAFVKVKQLTNLTSKEKINVKENRVKIKSGKIGWKYFLMEEEK